MSEHNHASPTDSNNWLPGLAEFLRTQANAEAIRVDIAKRKIEVATLGAVDLSQLEVELADTLRSIELRLQDPSFHASSIPAPFTVRKEGHSLVLSKPSCATAPRFWQWRQMPWPELKKPGCCAHEHDWEVLAALATGCGAMGLLGYFLSKLDAAWAHEASWVSFAIAFILGAYDAAGDVFKKLPKGQFDIHFLMLMVAVGASLIGAWQEGTLLLFLFSASGAMEAFALYRTRKGIDALFKKAPQEAWKIANDGSELRVPIAEVRVGDLLRVRPGDLFPVDARIVEGQTAADEANLTGEALPVDKKVGDSAYSGTLNLWGSVKVETLRPAAESSLQKIIRLIQEAQHLKAPSQRFTERFGTHYTFAILGITAAMFFVWWLFFNIPPFANTADGYSAFYRAMTLLVVASPCALVLSIPSAILAAIAWGATRGILFRGGAAIEQLADVKAVALDKTGTLTTGDLAVESVESFPPGQESLILSWAVSLEDHATHPLARAIVRHGRSQGILPEAVDNFKSLTGLGVQGQVSGRLVVLGRRELLEEGSLKQWAGSLPEPALNYSEVWVISPDCLGRILLKDQIRQESAGALSSLKDYCIRTIMLTGDRAQAALAVGKELGLTEVLAGLKPEGKVAALEKLKKSGGKVAMVGDGINDAPCLAAADIAVAMGARGSDAALEQSDIVLMNDRIDLFLSAYQLSRQARTIIHQNLALSLLTIIIMVCSSIAGIVPLALGVVAHEGSTAIVCLNSLRLLVFRKKP